MTKSLKASLRKGLVSIVMMTTIFSLSGIAAVIPVAQAATIVDGDVIQNPTAAGDAQFDVYIVKIEGANKYKRLVLNPQVFESYGHLKWENVQTVTSEEMNEYKTSAMVRVETDPKVYALAPNGDVGSKSWLNVAAETYVAAGGAWDQVYVINAVDGANYAAATDLTTQEQVVTFFTSGTLPGGEVVPSGLTAALSADTPATRTLVVDSNNSVGEAGADFAHFTFTGTGTVTAMNLQRFGISADSDLSNVYLYDGVTRITDGSSVTSGGVVNFNNPSGLFVVSGTKIISVRADLGNVSAGSTIGVKLVSFIKSGDATVATVNLSGNMMSTATSANLSAVTFTNGASAFPSTNTSLNPASDVVVWGTYTLTVSKDAWLNRLALHEVGSIAYADINNFRLYVDGTVVGAAIASLDANGYVTFDLSASPLKLLSGSRTFKVMADVMGGSNRTFTFNLRSVADIGLTDNQYGVGLTITGTRPTAGTQTVTAGSVSVQKDATSPSGNVTLSGSDTSLAKYILTVYGEPVKLDTLNVQVTYTAVGGSAVGSVRNGRVLIGGAQYGSTQSISTSASTSFTLNTTLPVGVNTVEVRGDIYDADGTPTLAATDTLMVQLNPGTTNNAQGTVSGTLSTVPAAATTVTANTVTVQSGSLAIAKTTSYPNQSTVVPQTNYKLASFQLTGNSTEAVNLNTFTVDFAASVGATFTAADLANVKIKYNSVEENSVKATVSAVASANTWSVSHTLPINGTAQIDIYADIGSTITNGNALLTSMSVSGITASSSTALYTIANGTSNSTAAVVFPGQIITSAVGTITSGLDASSPVASNLSDVAAGVTIGAFKWTATNDTYTLTDATFTLGGATTITSVSLKDGSAVLSTKPAAATVTFTGLSLPVAGATKILTLVADIGTVGVNAGTSGEAITATLTQYKTTSSTGTNATATVSTPAATSYAYAAVPTITQLALPSTTIGSGTKTLDKFSIASSGGTIGWSKFVFTVTKTSAPILTSPTLKNADTNVAVAGAFTILAAGAACTTADLSCTFTFVPTAEQQVSGTTNYVFGATIASAASTDSIQTTIAAPSTAHANPTTGFAYIDADNSGTVTAGDTRYAATMQVTSAYVQTTTSGVVGPVGAAEANDEVSSFGTFTSLQTIIVTADSATTISALTGTLIATGGFTCNAYDAAGGAGSITTTMASILSIKCTNGTNNQIVLNTANLGDALGDVTTITLTKGTDYAAASVVGTGVADSDSGLTIQDDPSFIWSDISAAGHTVGTTDWDNDFLVKSLPLDTANLY